MVKNGGQLREGSLIHVPMQQAREVVNGFENNILFRRGISLRGILSLESPQIDLQEALSSKKVELG